MLAGAARAHSRLCLNQLGVCRPHRWLWLHQLAHCRSRTDSVCASWGCASWGSAGLQPTQVAPAGATEAPLPTPEAKAETQPNPTLKVQTGAWCLVSAEALGYTAVHGKAPKRATVSRKDPSGTTILMDVGSEQQFLEMQAQIQAQNSASVGPDSRV